MLEFNSRNSSGKPSSRRKLDLSIESFIQQIISISLGQVYFISDLWNIFLLFRKKPIFPFYDVAFLEFASFSFLDILKFSFDGSEKFGVSEKLFLVFGGGPIPRYVGVICVAIIKDDIFEDSGCSH